MIYKLTIMILSNTLLTELDQNDFSVAFYKDNSFNEVNINDANEILISKLSEGIIKTIKAPKTKEVTFEWLMNKIYAASEFISLSTHCSKIIKGNGITIYPTSYGIGVFLLFGSIKEQVKEIINILDSNNIEYTNEFSDAKYVYRFKISKTKENINKLSRL